MLISEIPFTANNALSGEILSNVDSCSTLAALKLSSNLLSVSLPSEMWSLQSHDLSYNSLTKEFPQGISRMLQLVSLQGNKLLGKLLEDFGDCLLLKSIHVRGNLLPGKFPSSLLRLSMCTYLGLDSNDFSGGFLDWTGEMMSLKILDMSRNQLSGWIPNSIANLQALERLNLSEDGFTGSFPKSMASCIGRLVVDVNRNMLTGNLTSWLFVLGLRSIMASDKNLADRYKSQK